MALLGRSARSPHALAGRSMLGAGELPEAVIRPTVCAADLVCVPVGGANASTGLCASLVRRCKLKPVLELGSAWYQRLKLK
jgi:hypothetical protein